MTCLHRTLNHFSVYLYRLSLAAALRRSNDASGLSLLEVVLSIAIISISVGALVTISSASITGSDNARNRTVADQLVREGIEAARVYRDNNTYAAMRTSISNSSLSSGAYWYSLPGSSWPNGSLTAAAGAGGIGSTVSSLQCTSIHTNAYLVNGAYYRAVAFEFSSTNTNEMTIKSLVCYRYSGGNSQNSMATTVLSGWR